MLTPARAVILVIALASLVRLWFLPGIPLVITNDGAFYISWALDILEGRPVQWAIYRTPGYSTFMALVFLVAGVSPLSILIAQHGLAVATCGLIAFASARLAGPRLALMVGCLAALNPWLLGFAAYALTEVLSAFLLVLAATILMTSRRPSFVAAVSLGLVLAALVLVRPAFQVTVPIFIAGWLLTFSLKARPAQVTALVMSLVFLLAVSPWLWHNHQRGVRGLSGGSSLFIWIGVTHAGFLDETYELPDDIRDRFEELVVPDPRSDRKFQFMNEIDAFGNPESRRLLTNWGIHSIRQNPQAYAQTFRWSLLWQVGYFPRQGPIHRSDWSWMLWRLTQDGRDLGAPAVNIQTSQGPDLSRFATFNEPGPQRYYFARIAGYRDFSIVNLVLLGITLSAIVAAMLRRRWAIAAALGATVVYYMMHAVFLLAYDRFGVPVWIAWQLAPAVLVAQFRPYAGSRQDDTEAQPARLPE